MGDYYSVRGWLELHGDGYEHIVKQVKKLQEESEPDSRMRSYLKGWVWPESRFNGADYLFYGSYVKAYGLELLEQVLTMLIDLGYGLTGYFHIQDENDEQNYEYLLPGDDTIQIKEAKAIYKDPPETTKWLLTANQNQHAILEAMIGAATIEQLTQRGPQEQQSVKDTLAQLSAWNLRVIPWIKQMVSGEEVEINKAFYAENRKKFNNEVIAQNNERDVNEIIKDWRTSQRLLIAAIQQMPERNWGDSDGHWIDWISVYEATVEQYQEQRAESAKWLDL